VADRHTGHDLLLIAAFAAGDVTAHERAGADSLVAACPECAALVLDLGAIALATAELPAPQRPRDFFLRPEDAVRLRPHGLRRLVGAIGGARRPLVRPLAGGLMMVGMAGLLVAAIPGMAGPAALAPAERAIVSSAPGTEVQAQPGDLAASAIPDPSDAAFQGGSGGPGASLAPAAGGPASTPAAPAVDPDSFTAKRDTAAGPSALLLGSLALVAIGAGIFLVSLVRTGPRGS
jgi:anti-sigma factor RsiW